MSAIRKLFAMAALAAAAFGMVAGPAQTATLEEGQTAVIGEDYTFNTAFRTPDATPIGPIAYVFDFAPAAADAVLTAAFTYVGFPGSTFTGGFLRWSDGVSSVTQALVAGVQTTLAIPLAAAGPNQTLTVGFDKQSGSGILAGGVTVTEDRTAAIPLPASGLLLLGGLGMMALARRRRARTA